MITLEALKTAVEKNDVSTVKTFIKEQPEKIDTVVDNNKSLLHWILTVSEVDDVLQPLFDNENAAVKTALLNAAKMRDEEGRSPLEFAINLKPHWVASLLTIPGVPLNMKNSQTWMSPLQLARNIHEQGRFQYAAEAYYKKNVNLLTWYGEPGLSAPSIVVKIVDQANKILADATERNQLLKQHFLIAKACLPEAKFSLFCEELSKYAADFGQNNDVWLLTELLKNSKHHTESLTNALFQVLQNRGNADDKKAAAELQKQSVKQIQRLDKEVQDDLTVLTVVKDAAKQAVFKGGSFPPILNGWAAYAASFVRTPTPIPAESVLKEIEDRRTAAYQATKKPFPSLKPK